MIIYRPHRRLFAEAMKEAAEFENQAAMFAHIVEQETKESPFDKAPFSVDDLVIDGAPIYDSRNGWEDTRYVCTRKYYNEAYPVPQAIGFCATKYKK